MGENDLTTLDSERVFERATGESHTFVLNPRPAYVLEVDDIHFHTNSAVVLPDCDVDGDRDHGALHDPEAGLAVLAATLRYAKEHPSLKMLVTGHADTTATDAINLPLSEKRAKSVLLLLLGTREARNEWKRLVNDQSRVSDFKFVLKWIWQTKGWNTDPGEINDRNDAIARRAVGDFQQQYNDEFGGEPPEVGDGPRTPISVDRIVGPQTWGAIYEVYQESLKQLLRADDARMAEVRSSLSFVDDARRSVGCGEYFPIDEPHRDEYRSHENRRVEICFFAPEHLPPLDCHPVGGDCAPDLCQVCNPRAYSWTHIPVTPEELDQLWRLRIVLPGPGPLSDWPPLANKSWVLRRDQPGPDAEVTGQTNDRGELEVRVFDEDEGMTLEIEGVKLKLNGGDLPTLSADNEKSIKLRLFNIGYGAERPQAWTDPTYSAIRRAFKKRELGVDDDVIDEAMIAKLREVHGG